jgi:hypothetical protein
MGAGDDDLQILAQPLEERMPYLSLGRLGSVLDLGEELWLDPDALVGDALGVGLGLSDQRRQRLLQARGGCLVETVVDLAGNSFSFSQAATLAGLVKGESGQTGSPQQRQWLVAQHRLADHIACRLWIDPMLFDKSAAFGHDQVDVLYEL